MSGKARSDRARFECTCGSSTTFPRESFAKLHWLVGRFGYRNTESAMNDLRDCCDNPDYMETRGWKELREDDDGLRADGGYPWNVRIDLGGVTFEGPGMGSEQEAQAIKEIVESSEPVDGVQVIRQ